MTNARLRFGKAPAHLCLSFRTRTAVLVNAPIEPAGDARIIQMLLSTKRSNIMACRMDRGRGRGLLLTIATPLLGVTE